MATALRLLSAAVALLPWSALGRLGAALGWLFGSLLRVRRRAVEAAMDRAAIAAPSHHARAMYTSLGTSVLELLWLSAAEGPRREGAVRDHASLDATLEETLSAAMAAGPVVIAASHTSNWELAAFAAARFFAGRGKRFAVVAKPIAMAPFHAFCNDLRSRNGVEIVAPSGALGRAGEVLAGGGVVALMIDQVPDRSEHGTRVPFLGAPALADRAPAALAARTGATLVVVGARRHGRDVKVHLLGVLRPTFADAASVPQATRDASTALERFVREAPSEWLWLHRRWRAPRATRSEARPAPRQPLVAPVHQR